MGRLDRSAAEQRNEADAVLYHAHRLVFKYKGYRRATNYLREKMPRLNKRFTKKIDAFLEIAECYKKLKENSDFYAKLSND